MIGIGVGSRGQVGLGQAGLVVAHPRVLARSVHGGVGSALARGHPFARYEGVAGVQPTQPTITASAPTSGGVTLTSSAYSDPDGDPQLSSQWQITLAADTAFASPVYDSGEDVVNLEELVVAGVLEPETDYIARVRHREDLS